MKNIFHRPVTFGICIALYTIFQVTVGIYIAGVLTTLEKQYRITTSTSGFVLSISDIASLASIVVFTYIGKRWHRPRTVGALGLLSGLGGILSGVPHLIYPAYREGEYQMSGNDTSSNIFVCDVARAEEECTDADISNSGSRIDEMWALLLGQALMGIAYGPIFPIALTYIDDQVKGTTTPYYLALILTGGTTATLVGYGQAFLFLTTNVNWPAAPDYTKEWLGAWWLGFIFNGVIVMLCSVPFFFFPREMNVDIKEDDIPPEKLDKEGKYRQEDNKIGVKDFIAVSKRLCTNFVFMALLVGSIFDLAVSASFGFFMAKFLQVQFNIPATNSALYIGLIIMPAAMIGNMTSGVIVKKLKLTSKGCGRVVISLNSLAMCCTVGVYFVSCSEPSYAGFADGIITTLSSCNNNCTCSGARFEPVCGNDGLVYATPCFAGCTDEREDPTDDPSVNITVYTGCSCSAGANATDELSREAAKGMCFEPCNMIIFAGVLLFCMVLFGTLAKNPLVMMTMRSVGDDKMYGLGVQSLFGRALGFLPAPLYFGAAIAGTCVLDRIECGKTGDCLVYDAQLYRLTFLGIFFGLSVLGMLSYVSATVAVFRIDHKERQDGKYKSDIKNGDLHKEIGGSYNKGYETDEETRNQTTQTKF